VYTAGAVGAGTTGQDELLAAINRVRSSHGLQPLSADRRLISAARVHTRWMLQTNQFTHANFSVRIVRSKARGPRFGENLAWGTGERGEADAIVAAWMASPPHRANLLRPGFRRVGLGESTGAFAGASNAVVVTADFAGR
jgi:uncharacterized protein YkwD